jgi:hypothetical protein
MKGVIRNVLGAAMVGVAVAAVGGTVSAVDDGEAPPTAIELVGGGVISEATFPSDDGSMALSLLKERLHDRAGQDVGTAVWRCSIAEAVAHLCEVYLDLSPEASTGEGTIIAEGRFEGFSGEELAVTGGTGAYTGARGGATLSVQDDEFIWQLDLVP